MSADPVSITSPSSDPAKGAGEEGRRLPAEARQARVIAAVRTHDYISVAQIAADLGVSEMTIRRDLVELERAGHLVRTHGGARAPEGTGGVTVDREEPAFEARLRRNHAAKMQIARAALDTIEGRHTIVFDVGTTTFLMAGQLKERDDIKIFTNSLRIATLLGERKFDVYVPCGNIRGIEMSICGPSAVSYFENMWFDIAFIGVSGINSTGLFDYSIDDTELKRAYIRRSMQKVVICDSSKFQHMSLVQVAPLSDVDMLITDAVPPPDLAEALAAAGVQVLVAPPLKTG